MFIKYIKNCLNINYNFFKVLKEWELNASIKYILKLASILWLINSLFFGPVAFKATILGNSNHKLYIQDISLFKGIIFAPLIEEIIFRYILKFPLNITFNILILFFYIFSESYNFIYILINILLVKLILNSHYIRIKKSKYNNYFYLINKFFFRYILFLSSIIFSFMHLNNYFIEETPLWIMPAIILPQFFTSLILVIIRLNYGIGTSIILHSVFNLVPLISLYIIVNFF